MRKIKKILLIAFLVFNFFCFVRKNYAQEKNPVIIVPGITASWNWHVMAGSIFKDSWGWFPGAKNVYQTMIEILRNEGFDVYIAYYDWRESNAKSAFDFLKKKIEEVKKITGSSKVDIVAHSMGGLVARAYIQSNQFDNDVERLVLLGTPNHGSSDIYSPWEGGIIPDNWGKLYKPGIKFYIWYLKQLIPGHESNYELIHNRIPSLGELMPTYDFVQTKTISGNYATTTYWNMAIKNPFLDNLNNGWSLGDLQMRVYLSNLGGYNKATVGSIIVKDPEVGVTKWKDGEPKPFPPPRNNSKGDNRVLDKSVDLYGNIMGMPMPGSGPPINLHPGPEQFFEVGNRRRGNFGDTTHTQLPYRAIEETIYWLEHSMAPFDPFSPPPMPTPMAPPIEMPNLNIPPAPEEPEGVLDFFFTDNAEVEIIDPDGKIINNTNNEISGAEFNQASDSGPKIVYIPNPKNGEYKINIKGLSIDNDFDFAVYYASDNNSELDNFSDGFENGEEKTYKIEFDEDGESKIDSDMLFDINDLIDQVREYYDNNTISQNIDCEDENLIYEPIKNDFLSKLNNINLGKIKKGIKECIKIESWFETDNNVYQGTKSWYDILLEANQVY